MKNKLFMIFGPVIVAFLMFAALFTLPDDENSTILRDASQSMGMNIISGEHIKNKAISEKEYVPFFGSSELNRFDPFHPSVLAEKYHRSYRPFLIGSAGTQSLKQYMIISSMANSLKHKKAIFIISPQWFVKGGVTQEYFSHWYSGIQMYHWLDYVSQKPQYDKSDIAFAKRLKTFSVINENNILMTYLTRIIHHQPLKQSQKKAIHHYYKILSHEDYFYGRVGLTATNWQKVLSYTKQLPSQYNYGQLDHLASQIGKENTTSNNLQIDNTFYETRLRSVMRSLKGSNKNTSYLKSEEYTDFQLVLNEFAKNKTEVLFIIPPVNKYWIKYTGLSMDMLNQFSKKITQQLKEQGFSHVLNLVDDHESYFMTDTIHIGWRGWLRVDKAVRPFLESDYQSPDYHISNKYLSKKWQNAIPE